MPITPYIPQAARRTFAIVAILLCTLSGCNPLGSKSTVDGGDGTLPTGPVPVLVSPFVTNASPITVNISWTAAVLTFDLTLVLVSNGTASNLTGGGTNYSFQVVPVANGDVTLTFPVGAAQDDTGALSNAATLTIVYNTNAPTVTVNNAAGQTSPASTLPISYTVVFSEAIAPSSFTASTITQSGTASGITWAIIDSGDHTTFTLEATALSGNSGTIIPSINPGSVQDPAGNTNLASTSTNHTVMYLSTYPDIRLWLQADSLSLTNGASVTSWGDSSAFSNTVTEATNPPTFLAGAHNSLPAVSFSSDAMLMRSTSNSGITGNPDMTVVMVARVNGGTNYPTFLQIGETSATGMSAWFGLDGSSGNLFTGFYGGGTKSNVNYLAGFSLYTWIHNSGGGGNDTRTGNAQYWNGTAVGVTPVLPSSAVNLVNGVFRLGHSTITFSAHFDLAEMMIFPDTALGPAARIEIENYLNAKWALY